MKKIYILTAVFALLALSLNAQNKVDPNGNVMPPKSQTGKVDIKPDGFFRMGPSRASTTPVTPPYSNSFNSSDEWSWWETIDANSDGSTWSLSSNSARYSYDWDNVANDWLVTAPIKLKAGKTYRFYIDAWAYNGNTYPEKLEVKLASTNTATALSAGQTVIGSTTVNWDSSSDSKTLSNLNVTVNADGNYYIGIHAISDANQYYLYVDNFVIDTDITDPTIQVDENTVNMNSIPGTTVTEKVNVTGLNLTGSITATVGGQDASMFSVSPASLGISGGELTISYAPTGVGNHTATITLSSAGAEDVTITVNGTSTNDVIVCDGTNTTYYLPIYGNYAEQLQINQMIYPEIPSLIGKDITSITFYTSGAISSNLGDDTWAVKLGTTSQTNFGTTSASVSRLVPADVLEVYRGYLTTGSNTLTITFDTPFPYNGGNLLVDFEEITTSGNYSSTTFYGMSQSENTGYYSKTTSSNTSLTNNRYYDANLQAFLPKMSFTFEESGPKIVVSPETLTISDSGTNNTFTVQGSNLGDNVGVTVPQGSEFSTTTSDQYWGFVPNNGSVNGTVTVTYNGRALSATETVTAANNQTSATVEVTYVPDLYIVTDYGHNNENGYSNNGWDFANGTSMTNNNGIYTATFTADLPNTYIVFARKLGESNPWNTRYLLGPSSDGNWWLPSDGNGNGNIDVNNSNCIKIQGAGSYIVTINANDGTFTITKMVPDLAIALDAPAQVVGGNDATVTATVTNTGETPVTGYTVTITADGNTILTQTVNETLAVGATNELTVQYPTTAAQVGNTVNFAANVAYTDDGDATNNNATASMSIINMPAPENVVATGDSENQSATVTWDAPSILPIGTGPVGEGFDDQTEFEPFDIGDLTDQVHIGTIGGWTVYDPTGSRVWGVEDGDFPNMGQPQAWIVMNPSQATGISVTPHSPEQFMESICPLNNSSYTGGAANHWLISPELSGNAQTITFYERIVTTKYGNETYEVLASPNDIDNTDPSVGFTVVETIESDKTEWFQRTITLPAGTKHFAIHHISNDIFGMMVDDVTYEANDVPIAPVSYNIYLDGVLVGSVDANDPLTYDISNVSGGTHTASVSAVYPGNVESAATPSNTFTIQAKTPTPTIEYEVTNGTVVITATGEGHVTLEVDGITYEGEGSVTATVVRSPEDRIVTATATAQQDGALESNPASQPITIPALNTTPTNPESGLLRLHLLIVDQMKEEIPADNSHPDAYGYVLRYEPNGPNGAGMKESGSVKVEIQKADCEVMGAYTLAEVDNDKNIGAYDSETNTINHNLGMTMNAITADVEYDLSDDNDILYAYLLQGAENRLPGYQADYLTELQKTQNFTYVEMEETNPNKGHEYPNGEHHYFIGTDNLLTGAYGSSFVSYAPSVSTWGISRRYYEDDGYDNTYGAPIWKTGAGYVEMRGVPTAELQTGASGSTNWEYEGQACSLYILDNIQADGKLPKSTIATVQYEPYMFRVFVESKNGLLRNFQKVDGDGVTTGDHYEGIAGDTHGPICIWSGYIADAENDTYGQTFGQHEEGGETVYTFRKEKVERSEPDGEWDQDETNAIFAAVDALAISGYDQNGNPIYNNITEDDLNVFVRFYYVIKGSADEHEVHSGRAAGDSSRPGNGSESPGKSPSPWTAVSEVSYDGEVVSRTYVNSLGMQSDEPFDGVNIVITRYSDGKVSTTKVIR